MPTPAALTARSAIVYAVPLVRPAMLIGLPVPLAVVHIPPLSWYW